MATALRVQTLNSSGAIVSTYAFAEHEAMRTRVRIMPTVALGRGQSGDPDVQKQRDAWHEIDVQFRIHDDSTMTKLGAIRTCIDGGNLVRIYPAWIDQPDAHFDCFVHPDMQQSWTLAGLYRQGDAYPLTFIEADKASQIIVTDTIVT